MAPLPLRVVVLCLALAAWSACAGPGAKLALAAPAESEPSRPSEGEGAGGCHVSRPAPEHRLFQSEAIDAFLRLTLPRMKDEKLARILNVTLPNALDTTFTHAGWDDTFVITGDIPAMWLRDSTFQVMPYLRFVAKDPPLSAAMCGLLKRQASR